MDSMSLESISEHGGPEIWSINSEDSFPGNLSTSTRFDDRNNNTAEKTNSISLKGQSMSSRIASKRKRLFQGFTYYTPGHTQNGLNAVSLEINSHFNSERNSNLSDTYMRPRATSMQNKPIIKPNYNNHLILPPNEFQKPLQYVSWKGRNFDRSVSYDCGQGIFNRHLPGPNNEGLLLVGDDPQDSYYGNQWAGYGHLPHQSPNSISNSYNKNLRSNSEAAISSENSEFSPKLKKSMKRKGQRNPKPLDIAAREIENPTLHGYIDWKDSSMDDWVNVWGVFKDDTLYLYSSAIDDTAMDSLDINQWEVRQTQVLDSHHPSIKLRNQKSSPEYLRVDHKSDWDAWLTQLQHSGRMPDLSDKSSEESDTDSFSLSQNVHHENTNVPGKTNTSLNGSVHFLTTSRAQSIAQQKNEELEKCREILLQQLLSLREHAAQSLRERHGKRKGRSIKNNSGSRDGDTSIDSLIDDSQETEEDAKDITHLMQRKISMQFKLDYVKRHLQPREKPTHQKQKKFRLLSFKSNKPPTRKPTSPQDEMLARQAKDLSSRLSGIELDIEEKRQKMRQDHTSLSSPVLHTNQPSPRSKGSKNSLRHRKSGTGSSPNMQIFAEFNMNTENLSTEQKERIKAVGSKSSHKSSTPDMHKSHSHSALNRTWSATPSNREVIFEEEPSRHKNLHSSHSTSNIQRLFSRDASEPNSASSEPREEELMFDFKHRPEFNLAPTSGEVPDTPMRDMLNRRICDIPRKVDSHEYDKHSENCASSIDFSSEPSSRGISESALAQIEGFEQFIESHLKHLEEH